MFGLKKKTAVEVEEPPTREVISLEQEALERVKAADAELAAATGKLQLFVRQNFRIVDGSLAYASSVWNRDALDAQLRALLVAIDDARSDFHSALHEWAQYKKER